jgi:hypothetical protein
METNQFRGGHGPAFARAHKSILSQGAGLVARTQEFDWSSDRYYRRGKGPGWLDLDVSFRSPAGAAGRRFRLKSHAQAIKGVAQRVLEAGSRNPVARMNLTEHAEQP